MDSQLIISIGREFGSAGHEIAQHLAEHYNIPLLDSNLLKEVAKEKNMDIQKFHGLDEKNKKYGLYRTVRGFSSHPEDNVAFLQFDYLRKKAEKGESFVVVGRCSEDVLKEYDSLISIFILGDMECKKQRIKELYNLSDFSSFSRTPIFSAFSFSFFLKTFSSIILKPHFLSFKNFLSVYFCSPSTLHIV